MNYLYTGVGSRNTPYIAMCNMEMLAKRLGARGFTLRTGDAAGADLAFRRGAQGYPVHEFMAKDARGHREAMTLASRVHPAWHRLNGEYVKLLMARNGFQVLGKDLKTPSAFLVCWTPDGAETTTTIETGGTGQAIRLAVLNDVPVFNLRNLDGLHRLCLFVNENYPR